jgi:hypothetical protein
MDGLRWAMELGYEDIYGNENYGNMKREQKVIKTGLIGVFDEDNDFVIYCNEKEYKGKGFLFKCCIGCKHNPIMLY